MTKTDPQGRAVKAQPSPIRPMEAQIGRMLKQIRKDRGMPQEQLARAVGLTFQQIQKYERGQNRISASRLYEFAEILDCPLVAFYGFLERENPDAQATALTDISAARMARAINQITDPAGRAVILAMLEWINARA